MSDALIGGVVHAMNNRVTAMDGLAMALEDGDPVSDTLPRLQQERERLRALAEVARHIPYDDAGPEGCAVADLLEVARALSGLHPRLRDVQVEVRDAEGMPPLRVRQRAAEHAFLLSIAAAAAVGDTLLALCAATADGHVEVALRPRTGTASPSDEALELCAASDALVTADGGAAEWSGGVAPSVVVRLPSLALVRQRERASRR